MTITLFTTGGTIDKNYFDALSDYQVVESIIPARLAPFNLAYDIEVVPLLKKDSLEITAQDRELIRQSIASSSANKCLVTHGSDTMVDTAKALQGIEGKTIVLTGAMMPSRFHDSDALFNIGVAIGALQSLENGVYVAMSGAVFSPDEVIKNRAAQRFELKSS